MRRGDARRGGRGAVLGSLVTAAIVFAVVAACSGGKSQNLPEVFDASQLNCLVSPLVGACCPPSSSICIGTFAAAEECSSWPKGATLTVFPTPCQGGLTAVRATLPGETFFRFYVYDGTGALYALGDNAGSPDPRSGAIECGAGPKGFVIPTACADAWLGSQGSQACGAGTVTSTSICH